MPFITTTEAVTAHIAADAEHLAAQNRTFEVIDGAFVVTDLPQPEPEPAE